MLSPTKQYPRRQPGQSESVQIGLISVSKEKKEKEKKCCYKDERSQTDSDERCALDSVRNSGRVESKGSGSAFELGNACRRSEREKGKMRKGLADRTE